MVLIRCEIYETTLTVLKAFRWRERDGVNIKSI